MKKIITLLLSIAVVLTTMLPIYAESASISVQVSPSVAHPGDTVTVTVTVTGTPATKNLSISSSYDSGLLSLVGGSSSNSVSSNDPKNWGGSRISYSLTIRNDAPITSTTISGSCSVSDPESASGSGSATLSIVCNHDFSSKAESKYLAANATCEHPALYYYYCSKCGESEGNSSHVYEVGEKLSHIFDAKVESEKHLATAGDCKTYPKYYYSCSLCGTNDTTHTFESTKYGDHVYVNTIDKKYLVSEASCTKKAVYYSHCSVCDEKGSTFETGNLLEHDFTSFKELDENYHVHKCSSCGKEEKEEHKWDEGVTKKKATEIETGLIEYTCKICNAKKQEEIKRVDTRQIVKPIIDVETREYFYSGNEIEFIVPDSDYYIVSGNKQINAGEYDVVISLTKPSYSWEDGTTDDITYKFVIEKSDYDMTGVEFLDGAGISDGTREYSLLANNLPDGVSATYNYVNEKNPGTYDVIVSFTGDNNHNEIPDMHAKLYILEKPIDFNTIYTNNGSVTGYLPSDLNFTINTLETNDTKYIDAKTEVINTFDIDEGKVLSVCDLSLDYNGLTVQPISDVNVNMQVPDMVNTKFKLYHIHTDEYDNEVCEEIDYETQEDGSITFTLEGFSQIVFVKSFNFSIFIPIIVGFDILVVIILAVYLIRKKKNNRKKNKKVYVRPQEVEPQEEEHNEDSLEDKVIEEPQEVAEEITYKQPIINIQEEIEEEELDTTETVDEENIQEDEAEEEETIIVPEEPVAVEVVQENTIKVEETEVEEIVIDDTIEDDEPDPIKIKKKSFIGKIFGNIKEKKTNRKEKAELAKAAKEAVTKEEEKTISDIKATSIYKIEDISDDDD